MESKKSSLLLLSLVVCMLLMQASIAAAVAAATAAAKGKGKGKDNPDKDGDAGTKKKKRMWSTYPKLRFVMDDKFGQWLYVQSFLPRCVLYMLQTPFKVFNSP